MRKLCSIAWLALALPSFAAKPSPSPTPAGPPPAPFRVVISGKGPAVLFIPGAGSSGEVWNGAVNNLKFDHECHVFTLAGFNGMKAMTGSLYDNMQAELVRYIEEHQLKRPAIVGFDFGGFLALTIASKHPNLLGPLVLIDTPTFLPAEFNAAATAEIGQRMGAMIRGSFLDPRSYLAGGKAASSQMASRIEDQNRVFDWFVHSYPLAVTEAMATEYEHDLRKDVANITSNVLVIATCDQSAGGASESETEQIYRLQYKSLPHVRFAFINSKQLVMLEQTDNFALRTRDFLRAQDDEPVSFGN